MMQNKITSLSNPKIKAVAHLRNHRKRKEEGLTVVEGVREVSRALESRVKFREVFFSKEYFDSAKDRQLLTKFMSLKVPVYETANNVFEKISFGERNGGILGVCETPRTSLDYFKLNKEPVFVVVENIEKPGNLGAVLRTCDGAGIDGVIVTAEKTDLYNPNVIRSSLGAVFTVKTVVCSNDEAFNFLKSKKIRIYSALPQAKTYYVNADFKKPAAVVLGSEDKGLSDFWVKNSDEKISIPMKGKIDSLNVSISAAVIIYEVLRQRCNK